MAIASSLDLISLDNLSRTCHQIHASLLQYRAPLKSHTLHCVYEDVELDPDDTLRYRARAGNWFYMEDIGRSGSSNYNGKSGQCARDMVAECRRCARVVCRVSLFLAVPTPFDLIPPLEGDHIIPMMYENKKLKQDCRTVLSSRQLP